MLVYLESRPYLVYFEGQGHSHRMKNLPTMDARYDEYFVLKWSVQPRIKNNTDRVRREDRRNQIAITSYKLYSQD